MRFFTLKEMTATSTKIKNFPETWEQMKNLERLTLFLDKVRFALGKPIRVNSGFRSPYVNVAVKGSPMSAHLDGLAADIEAWSGVEADNRRICAIIESIGGYDQLLVYHEKPSIASSKIRFIHVSLPEEATTPRNQLIHL
jgi:hypothetical protein